MRPALRGGEWGTNVGLRTLRQLPRVVATTSTARATTVPDVAGAVRLVGDAVRVTMLSVAKLIPSMQGQESLALVEKKLSEMAALLATVR